MEIHSKLRSQELAKAPQSEIVALLVLSDQSAYGLAKVPVVYEDVLPIRAPKDQGIVVSDLAAHFHSSLKMISGTAQSTDGDPNVQCESLHEIRGSHCFGLDLVDYFPDGLVDARVMYDLGAALCVSRRGAVLCGSGNICWNNWNNVSRLVPDLARIDVRGNPFLHQSLCSRLVLHIAHANRKFVA